MPHLIPSTTTAHGLRLPYPPLILRVLRTSAALWLLARFGYVLVLLIGVLFFGILSPEDAMAAALHPAAFSRVLLVALTPFLVWLHRRRAHEHLLQANCGVSQGWFGGASLLTAGVLDLTVQAFVGLL